MKNLLPCIIEQVNNKDAKVENKGDLIHEGFECKACAVSPIKGIRYNCPKCTNFNLCEICEEKVEHEHNLLKIRKV